MHNIDMTVIIQANWQTISSQPSQLGESPFWHPHEQQLYWVDIPGRQILRANVFMGTVQTWDMPLEPGCIAPAASGGLVIALRDGIYRAHEWGGALTLIQRADYDTTTTRFNDGKADPLGRFWAGTIFEPRTALNAELFSFDSRTGASPKMQRMAGNAITANGLAWSPDATTLYWSDTANHIIRAWDWNAANNTLSNPRVFHQFPLKPVSGQQFPAGPPQGELAPKGGSDPRSGGAWGQAYSGRPDGAAVDTQGNYYVAMFEGQRILKLSSAGDVLAEIPTPAQCPTMPCFGGDDWQTLYITTARYNRSAQELADMPQSGCVFSMRVDVPGLPTNFFID